MTDPKPVETNEPIRLPFYRRFGVKVATVFLILILAAMGASAYVSIRAAGAGFTRVVSQEFQSTLGFSENYLHSLGDNWANWARHFTIDEHDHGFSDAIVSRDRETIKRYIHEHLPSAFSKVATVLDVNGRVLYRAHELGKYGDSLNHVGIVQNALNKGEIGVAIVNDLNRFMLYAAAPVVSDNGPAGVLLVGSVIDNAFVEQIKANTGVELAIVRDRAVMGSTLKDVGGLAIGDLPIPYLEYQMLLTRPDRVLETRFLGQRYFVATQKLGMMDGNTPGSLFLAVPRLRLDLMEAEIYQDFLYLILAVAILVLIVGGVISHRLSKPLIQLTDKANAIADGRLDAKFDHISKDELGILATSFNAMQDAIRTKNAELQAYSETLEFKVKERTMELEVANQQMLSAKESAEEANLAKSHFLSSMSHELRTPLNAILGFGQLLTYAPKDKLNESQADAVNQILKGGEHLLELINEILDLAKIESGQLKLDVETVAPLKAIKQCLLMSEPMAGKYDVEIEPFSDKNALPAIKVDAMRLKQILLNLLSNAVKYNRTGGTVTLKCAESSGGMLRFSISDTGNGIPEDMQEKLFMPFERMGYEASNIEGTGIGLNITKDLVESMNGLIGLKSRVGIGSTFWVEFPVADEASLKVEAETEAAAIVSQTEALPPSLADEGTHSIIYVEDNPANIELMKELISMMGNLHLRTAKDAELGIAMAQGDQPDLILMDIHLPGMSGIEALRVLKKNGETAHIPVLAISADAMPESIDKAMAEGFEGYLTKPFNLTEIVEAISSTLKRVK